MKKNLVTLTLVVFLCAGMILTGCSSNDNAEEVQEEKEETVQVIGDSSAPLEVDMTNNLGSVITGLSVKTPAMLIFPDNMMTADQSIENGGTVKFYYNPEDTSAEDVNVQPTQNYMGYWNQSGSTDEELDIWNITDDTVTFHLWWYKITETEDITVTLDENHVGTFNGTVNGDYKIEGKISFTDTSVKVTIGQSDFEYIDPEDGPYVFDEKHAASWEYGDEEEAAEEDETGAESDHPFMLQLTLADNTAYELSDFAVDDMKDVTLCYEDETAYLEYTKTSTDEIINTKEQEQTIKQDKEAAQAVMDQITLIGTVTLESEEDITSAREAYDALTDAQKRYVYNEPSLKWKEVTLSDLIREDEVKKAEKKEAEEEKEKEAEKENVAENEIIGDEGEDPYSMGYNYGYDGCPEDDPDLLRVANNWKAAEQEGSTMYVDAYNEFWNGYHDGYSDWMEGLVTVEGFDWDSGEPWDWDVE